ncbi:MAG: hypothetical protein II956_13695 [Bacteroidales bacterium]|nr:hypothetical protein [Bacteroidales bacterium]
MKTIKFNLLLAFLLTISISVSAQNPYAEIEKDGAEYATTVTFAGQKPIINDFISHLFPTSDEIDEMNSELDVTLGQVWARYKKNTLKPTEKVTADSKNGFACFEINDPDEGFGKEQLIVDVCYWNSSDTKHKVVAESVKVFRDGKVIETELTGLSLYVYNNATHKLTYANRYDMGVDITTDGEAVTYDLPRVGKDIKAFIHLPSGKKEVLVKWNGSKFEVQK